MLISQLPRLSSDWQHTIVAHESAFIEFGTRYRGASRLSSRWKRPELRKDRSGKYQSDCICALHHYDQNFSSSATVDLSLQCVYDAADECADGRKKTIDRPSRLFKYNPSCDALV